MKPFRIFRPGKHRAACGTVVEFKEEDLVRAVGAYNPALYKAPFVLGHPKSEDRAWGWAGSLSYSDGHVVVHPEKLNPKFSEAVEEGGWPNRSASWYMPDHPNNPVPGVLYPKHIGFLGAVPPALKGLGDIEFSEAGGQLAEFAADDHPELVLHFAADADEAWSMAGVMSSMARMARSWRDMLLADKGQEEADKLIPSWQVEDMERQAIRQEERARNAPPVQQPLAYNEDPNPNPKETPTMTPEEIAAMQAQNADQAARLAQFAQRETALAVAERVASVAAIDATLDPLVKAGRILPAHRAAVASFMADLPDTTGEGAAVVEFGEPVDGVTPKLSPRAFMAKFLASLPKSVDFSERGGQTAENSATMTARELAQKATDKRNQVLKDQGRTISFSEATNLVLQEAGIDPNSIETGTGTGTD